METLIKKQNAITLHLSKSELGMLYSALHNPLYGFKFDFDTIELNRRESESLFSKIRSVYKSLDSNNIIFSFSNIELKSLTKLHEVTMEKLDPIEYPTITGYSFAEAQQLLSDLQQAVDSI